MDIFGKEQKHVPIDFVTSDLMILRVGLIEPGEEYLVQTVSFQYNQPINRLYEIGSANAYFAHGRSIGTLQIGRIIGEKLITELMGPVGTGVWSTDLSKGAPGSRTIVLKKKGNTNQGANLQYIFLGAIIESYGAAMDANGMLVQENVTMQYGGLIFGTGLTEADLAAAATLGS